MPETPVFHLTPNYAHVVVNGVVHLIPNGDVRFPWIVQACLHHEFSMAHALLNEQPADSDETATQWALEVDGLPEDVYYDFQQACALACAERPRSMAIAWSSAITCCAGHWPRCVNGRAGDASRHLAAAA